MLVVSLYPYLHSLFFFNDTATTEIYTLSLHDALPICTRGRPPVMSRVLYASRDTLASTWPAYRSEEHTSELQSLTNLVCRLLLEKKKHIVSPPAGSLVCTTATSIVRQSYPDHQQSIYP